MTTIIELTIKGQVRGGKNNMKVTRTGQHYPDPKFVVWRNNVMGQIRTQTPYQFKPIEAIDLIWDFKYTPEDNRRRDLPAILDAIFHCLEKANIVRDDCLIKNVAFTNYAPSKEAAGIIITVFPAWSTASG